MPTTLPVPPGYDLLADQRSLAPRALIAHGRALGIAAAGVAGLGLAGLAWGRIERRLPAVRHVDVPVGPGRDIAPLTILQISDLHLYPGQDFLVSFLAKVARAEGIDFVISTGDNLGSADGVDLVRRAYAPFLDLPGAFVLGSNDYYSPTHKSWATYLRRDPRVGDTRFSAARDLEDEYGSLPTQPPRDDSADPSGGAPSSPSRGTLVPRTAPDLPWRAVVATMRDAGWIDLSNRSASVTVPVRGGTRAATLSLTGVDDPHLDRDRIPAPDPSWTDPATLHVAVSHAPYVRVVDAFTALGADLVVAGHTHGGQMGIPFMDPLVTNCDLPRHYGRGLHRWTSSGRSTWLNVSAGLGTSPFVPLRIGARPEVTVMHLRPGV